MAIRGKSTAYERDHGDDAGEGRRQRTREETVRAGTTKSIWAGTTCAHDPIARNKLAMETGRTRKDVKRPENAAKQQHKMGSCGASHSTNSRRRR